MSSLEQVSGNTIEKTAREKEVSPKAPLTPDEQAALDALYEAQEGHNNTPQEELRREELLRQLESPTVNTASPQDVSSTPDSLASLLEKPLNGVRETLAFPGDTLGTIPPVNEINKKIEGGINGIKEAVGDGLGVPIAPEMEGKNYIGDRTNKSFAAVLKKHIPFLKHLSLLEDTVGVVDDIAGVVRSEQSPPEKFNSFMGSITGFAGKTLNGKLFGIPKVAIDVAKQYEDKEPKPPYDPVAP